MRPGQAPGWAWVTFPSAKHRAFSPAFSDLRGEGRDCLAFFNKLLFRLKEVSRVATNSPDR